MEIKAFLLEDLDAARVETIGAKIEQIEGVKEVEFETKETALEKYKEQLGDNSSLLEGWKERTTLPQLVYSQGG